MNQNTQQACDNWQGVMVDVLFGEADQATRSSFEAHVSNCESCASEYASMRLTLSAAANRTAPEPRSAFIDGLENRLSEIVSPVRVKRLPIRRGAIPAALASLPRWSLQLAAGVSILVIGVLLGQGMQQPDPAGIAAASSVSAADAEMIAVEARAFSYLDRSKMLLLDVVNFDAATEDPASLGSPHRNRLAQNLLQEASFLKTRLSRSDQQRLKALVGELEVILLQLANLEERVDIPDIEIVRDGVDRNAILFKIDLEEMRRSLDESARTETSSARAI